ncbi:MAG: hypothetical protein KGS00_03190 [Alphaproteobacteria bacterium]|nr:hypothetical protein [Alphaproteobacteria bacterium]
MKARSLAALIALLTVSGTAYGHSPGDNSKDGLKGLVASSALVISGRVARVVYQTSQPTNEEPQGVPHTFVTYEISEVIRGKLDSKLLTLRFPGGADGRGGVYMDTSSPAFATGQTDILFIRPGGSEDCPLVGCVDGRFRISDKAVFNAWGVPVVEASPRLRVGGKPRFDLNVMEVPRPSFDQLIRRPEIKAQVDRTMPNMSVEEMRKRYESEAPKSTMVTYGLAPQAQRGADVMGPAASAIETFPPAMTPEAFATAVRKVSAEIPLPQGGQVTSADPTRAFTVKSPTVADIRANPGKPASMPEEALSLREGDDLQKSGPTTPAPIAPTTPITPGRVIPTLPR